MISKANRPWVGRILDSIFEIELYHIECFFYALVSSIEIVLNIKILQKNENYFLGNLYRVRIFYGSGNF